MSRATMILGLVVTCIRVLLALALVIVTFKTVSKFYTKKVFEALEEDPETSQPSAFSDFMHKMRQLMPFMWPKNRPRLQLLVFASILLLGSGRAVNLLVPMQYKVSICLVNPLDHC
jgi:hypothetical protein